MDWAQNDVCVMDYFMNFQEEWNKEQTKKSEESFQSKNTGCEFWGKLPCVTQEIADKLHF